MLLIRNITLKEDDPKKLRKKVESLLGSKDFVMEIYKKSIDARKEILFRYQVIIRGDISPKVRKRLKDAVDFEEEDFSIPAPHHKSKVLIVGSGPAGLFCAYILAKYGSKPVIIEQGESMEARVKTMNAFLNGGNLDPYSNVQFGEGGAGTFSDGKLTARSKDKRQREVLRIFVDHGAPEDILYDTKPHIGTDILRQVIIRMRKKIESWGGEFYFSSEFQDLELKENKVLSFVVNGKKKKADTYVLALGNSSRKTFQVLSQKIQLKNKAFAVGFRIEHKKNYIDQTQYHGQGKNLPAATYSLKYTDKEQGLSAYTFCMCPGGEVINASSEPGHLVVNGMSYHARDQENSNSAVIVTVDENIYGKNILDGIRFQEKIERKAFVLGGENYYAPVQKVEDFMENRKTRALGSIEPTVKPGYTLTNLRGIYPEAIDQMFLESLKHMDKKLPGFAMGDAMLTGVETRSSSPVYIVREKNMKVVDVDNLYAIGEGSGYAGGIVSSAIDGIKAAEKMILGEE